jgi:hypothetical protein
VEATIMNDFLPLLVLLACPVAMILLMRGMHSQRAGRTDSVPDPRITALEEEVARLRAANPRQAEPPAAGGTPDEPARGPHR